MLASDIFDGDALLAMLEGAAAPLVVVDADEIVQYANPMAAEMFGYEREELIGLTSAALSPPERAGGHRARRAAWAEPIARADGGGRDLWARRRDGTAFPVEVAVTPVTTPVGHLRVVGLMDISARLTAEHNERHLARAHLAMAELNDATARALDAESLVDAGLAAFGKVDQHASLTVVRSGNAELSPRIEAAVAPALHLTTPHVGPTEDGLGRIAVLPVVRGGEVMLRIVLVSADDIFDDPSVRSVLDTMTANLSGALDRIAQRDRLQRVESQRLDLFRRLLAAQDDERRRIAADVHDDSIQALAALQLRVGLLAHRLSEEGHEASDSLARIETEVARVMTGLRTLLFELEPISTATSLVDVVSEVLAGGLVDGVELRDVAVDWSAHPDGPRDPAALDLAPDLRGQCARILKEALRNVARHARASWVQVQLRPDPEGVEIAVVDDGQGFPAGSGPVGSMPGHRGVAGMLDRAALCGGWCCLEREGSLTTLRFWLPRDPDDADQLAPSPRGHFRQRS